LHNDIILAPKINVLKATAGWCLKIVRGGGVERSSLPRFSGKSRFCGRVVEDWSFGVVEWWSGGVMEWLIKVRVCVLS